ncbi:MAG: hypothetical protein IKM45_00270 [Opitutales bacterium]|nr:hypothetical protein [Opitutales bacterium]
MKTKITAVLALLVSSVFAFAQAAAEAPTVTPAAPEAQVCPAQPKKCPKARPQISQEMREAFVQRILLSLSEEDLSKLAEKVAAVQKMTPEQKAEALKALPKPEFRPNPKMKKHFFRGHCGPKHCKPMPRCAHRGKPAPKCCGMKCAPALKCHMKKCGKPHPKMKKHPRHVRRGPGIKSCCGANFPGQPAQPAQPVAAPETEAAPVSE